MWQRQLMRTTNNINNNSNVFGSSGHRSFSIQSDTSCFLSHRRSIDSGSSCGYGSSSSHSSPSSSCSSSNNYLSTSPTIHNTSTDADCSPHHYNQTDLERQMNTEAISICQARIYAIDPTITILAHLTSDPQTRTITVQQQQKPTINDNQSSLPPILEYVASDYDRILLLASAKRPPPWRPPPHNNSTERVSHLPEKSSL